MNIVEMSAPTVIIQFSQYRIKPRLPPELPYGNIATSVGIVTRNVSKAETKHNPQYPLLRQNTPPARGSPPYKTARKTAGNIIDTKEEEGADLST
jgi:hypothetical protein